MKEVNPGTITGTLSWYKISPLNEFNPCKTKTSQETEKSSRKFLEPPEKPEVINTDNSLEFGHPGSIQGDFIYRHHVEPRVQFYVPKKRVIPFSTEIH